MFRQSVLGSVCAAVLAVGSANAGMYSDDLSRCLVKSASVEDKTDLVAWIFVAISHNPAVQQYVTLSASKRAEIDRTFTTLVVRLLSMDCRSEALDALKYEGPSVIESSFSILGQVAARELMNNPQVAAAMETIGNDVDTSGLDALLREAGISP